jgi:hypothetical protein
VTVDAGRALPSARSNNFANISAGWRAGGVAGGGAAAAAGTGDRVAFAAGGGEAVAMEGGLAVVAGADVAVAAGVGVAFAAGARVAVAAEAGVTLAGDAGVTVVAEAGAATAARAHASPSVNSISYASPDTTPLGPGSIRESWAAAGFADTGRGFESGCEPVGANSAWGGWSGSKAALLTAGTSDMSPAELSGVVFPHRPALRVRRKTAAAITIPAATTTMTNST